MGIVSLFSNFFCFCSQCSHSTWAGGEKGLGLTHSKYSTKQKRGAKNWAKNIFPLMDLMNNCNLTFRAISFFLSSAKAIVLIVTKNQCILFKFDQYFYLVSHQFRFKSGQQKNLKLSFVSFYALLYLNFLSKDSVSV